MGHRPIFSAFWDSVWTRLSVDSGLGKEGQSTGLHDTLTLPLDFWLWGRVKTLVYWELIRDLRVLQQRLESACQEFRVKQQIYERERTAYLFILQVSWVCT